MASANVSEIQQKWKSLLSQTILVLEDVDPNWGSIRLDVQSLRPFLSELNEQDSGIAAKDPVLDAVELFWNQYQPLRRTIDYPKLNLPEAVAETLSSELEQLILDLLHHLQVQNEVPPREPDGTDSQWIEELQVHLHIVAARAFRIMRKENGHSEAARECLEDAEKTIERIRFANRATGTYDIGVLGNTLADLSTNAVSALVLAERCRIQRDAEAALHYFARADLLFYLANSSIQMPSQMEERLQQPVIPRPEAYNLFEEIKSNRLAVQDWQQVTRDCTEILEGWTIGDDAEVSEWIAFWMVAKAWASAQLSPSEARKERDKEKENAAKRRLQNYFFGDDWAALPERAQQRLINADVNWNSRQEMAREAILNDLLRATVAMCYEFIWESLAESSVSSLALDYFLKLDKKIANDPRKSAPNARDYVDMCRARFFPGHLREKGLAGDIKYMTKCFPRQIGKLIDHRNDAEYETTSDGVIADCYRTFLGIGSKGVLPELARIGRKLRGRRRGRR